ncbi:nitrite reductase large subunit NirB [Reinekea marinisedimentorum]|uniref:Nitrite reductase (NADH) large subunit n=1 Tax=Reinekea marinisedimentorum TaxID=230495 RepID=A0A4V6NY20_9GAMM|nr:nitrite reductase large subunit NirB [Reinekea marinisedimentorum]TCS39770.1 nitrite reductase (NADH) large subunit [Reinekea marinisedimentorum]
MNTATKKNLVIIGNGMVGHHFVSEWQKQANAANWQLHIIGEEAVTAYDRVHLSEYFQGKNHAELAYCTEADYLQQGIKTYLGKKATGIDRSAQTVTLSSGEVLNYDKVVLATGSYAFVPPIPGYDNDRCFVYRTLDDLDAMKAAAQGREVGVVIGGGLLGLEAANALKSLGLKTHVVEFAPRLMPVQLDDAAGGLLKEKIEDLGVSVLTKTATQSIEKTADDRLKMTFAEGEPLETDLLVFSAGIRPQDALAKECGLELGERGGVVINDHCQTSDENIYAIGEVALWKNQIFGLVAPGFRMAETTAADIAGEPSTAFLGADMSTKLKLLGVDVGSIGDAHAATPGALTFRYSNEHKGIYKKLVTTADGKKMLGAILVGDNSSYDTLLQYHLNDIDLPAEPDSLILPNLGSNAAPALGVDALPDTATICSCLNVSKGDIVSAIDNGCCSPAEVKDATGAGSGCGGCSAMVKDVVNATMEARGITVDKSICEHFHYTRQEIYHLILVEKIRTFDELLDKHGEGLGCDVCKPVVSNILAAVWNAPVQNREHVKLQDTNDAFLGNMQKDGTYSVIPRIAGGEITPEKIMKFGEIAAEFNLYTKVVSAQRIGMFGAQVHELPQIWQKLIDAGFETGQAYGKSLRNVKSCIGSTWCRYGVQDSVGMAILVENRYKGLRGPHKFKFGVSGCTRECAEAQGKDVGIIATENGWNLYVCGNGGMKPRHGDLFATDLSDVELIKIIDRFLMFYSRTADGLQRTARWMENLEGGLDYLKDVILNDSLGICDELEAQMNHVVETWECEWASTLKDPEKLKRFRTFVNSDEKDNNVVFVEERNQIRPATKDEKLSLIASA